MIKYLRHIKLKYINNVDNAYDLFEKIIIGYFQSFKF